MGHKVTASLKLSLSAAAFLGLSLLALFPVREASVAAQSSQVFVFIESEVGGVTAPMQIANDPNASAGRYITVAAGNNSSADPPTAGIKSYQFNVASAGTYKVWGRVIARTTSDDSFWV